MSDQTVITESELVRRQIGRLERDRDARLQTLDSLIAEQEHRGIIAEAKRLTEQRATLDGIYDQALGKKREELQMALDVERKKDLDQRSKDAHAQAKIKARYQVEWRRNGGDPKEFETAWPELWASYLEEMTIKGVNRRESLRGSKIRL